MKTKKSQPKMSGLVVAALRNLRDAHGSTAKEIMKYIMAEYNASEATVQRQLRTALKRGVEYGILKKTTAGYSLNTDAEVIGPLDLAQMDSCGKRRKRHGCSMRRKRSACGIKKKRKRASCAPRRRRKKNPCGMCAARGRKGDCSSTPVQLVREVTPNPEEEAASNEANRETGERRSRSRSTSRAKQTRNRSRSQSMTKSQYSGSENEDDRQEDDMM